MNAVTGRAVSAAAERRARTPSWLPLHHVLARPNALRLTRSRVAVFVVCLLVNAAVLLGEDLTPSNVTFGGFSLLTVLLATWTLPSAPASIVAVVACLVPLAAILLNAVDAVTGDFQFAAAATATVTARLTVIAVERSQREERRTAAELAEAAALAERQAAELAASHERMSRFTADAAHELRAPLAIVRSAMEVTLARGRTAEEYRDALVTALREVQHLSGITDDLLLLARSDAGSMAPEVRDVEMPDLVADVVARWQQVARRERIRLAAQLEGDGLLRCDPQLLTRLLDNLLANAFRHTPKGGLVTVATSRDGAAWRISVADTGPGVSAEVRPHMFERFTRDDRSRTRGAGGSGLGLSLCAAIAEAHGGAIRLDEGHTGGARFEVSLPAGAAADGSR